MDVLVFCEIVTMYLLLLWLPKSERVTCCTMDSAIGLTSEAQSAPGPAEDAKQLSRRGTRDKILVFTSIIEPPFLQRTPQEELEADETVGGFQGFIPDLISKVARKLRQPFAIKLVNPGQGGYGVDMGAGRWNGMIGEVMSGEADVATGALTITATRQEVIDFTRPFMTAGIAGVMKRSPDGAPLDGTSPLELADRMDLHFGLIFGSLTYNYFRNSNETQLKRLWHRVTTENPPYYERSSKSGIDRVRNSSGDYVFLVESVFAEHHVSEPPCNLLVLESLVNLSEYAFAVKKGSGLKRRIDRALSYFEQNGSIQKLKDKWWAKSCSAKRDKKKKNPRTQEVLKSNPFTTVDPSVAASIEANSTSATVASAVLTTSLYTTASTTAPAPTYTTVFTTSTGTAQTKKPYHSRKELGSHTSDVTRWLPRTSLLGLSLCCLFLLLNPYWASV